MVPNSLMLRLLRVASAKKVWRIWCYSTSEAHLEEVMQLPPDYRVSLALWMVPLEMYCLIIQIPFWEKFKPQGQASVGTFVYLPCWPQPWSPSHSGIRRVSNGTSRYSIFSSHWSLSIRNKPSPLCLVLIQDMENEKSWGDGGYVSH